MTTVEQARTTVPLHRPSLREMLFFFVSGAVVSIPMSIFFESLGITFSRSLPELYAVILSVAVLAPVIEEFGKAYPLFFRHGETERSIINLGLLVGLGFGIVEFIEYVFLFGVPFYYRLAGILFHPATTGIIAFGIARKQSALFYLLAVLLHVSNNLIAILAPYWTLSWLVIATTFLLFWQLYKASSERLIKY